MIWPDIFTFPYPFGLIAPVHSMQPDLSVTVFEAKRMRIESVTMNGSRNIRVFILHTSVLLRGSQINTTLHEKRPVELVQAV
jgi:hypothetical protein